MEQKTDISIVIPVYNSATMLESLVAELKTELEKNNKVFEVIMVDDGSRDASWETIKKLRSVYGFVKGFRLSKNYGQQKAIFCGLHHCTGEIIVTMDDDHEHPVSQIIPLCNELTKSNNDIIYALSEKNKYRSVTRYFATRFYKYISRVENPTGGEGSSFRFMKKQLVKNLCTHMGHLIVLDELVLWHTGFVAYKKIKYNTSLKKNSGYSYLSLFAMMKNIFLLSTTAPLVIVKTIGMSVSTISFLFGIYYFIRKIIFKVPAGYTSVIVSILFGTGLILLCLAIIGEYLGNILMMQNNKPAYTVKETA